MEFKPTLYQDLANQETLKGEQLAHVAYDFAHLIVIEAKMSLVDGAKQYTMVTYTFRNRDPESDTLASNSATFYLMVDNVHQIATFTHKGRDNLQTWGIPYGEVKVLEDFFNFYIKEVSSRPVETEHCDESCSKMFKIAAMTNARLEPDHTVEFVSYDHHKDAGVRLVVDDTTALEIPFDGIERIKLGGDLHQYQEKAAERACECMVRLVYTALYLHGDSVDFRYEIAGEQGREIQIWSPDATNNEKKLISGYLVDKEVLLVETDRGVQGVQVPQAMFRQFFVDPVQQYRQFYASTLKAVSQWDEWLKAKE